ncbi:TetR family transcriptional regulator [Chelativorans sp. Marseille-P2723]|uniref:TetR family transcriptional regulator n=1 Tax=Chelativorans sp. Marseille-P2723 TaxID=2709133 RepID=UPI0015715C68|nr:TetR family transcriptional regulator [Chelativorans sp. Marseille-P2723]
MSKTTTLNGQVDKKSQAGGKQTRQAAGKRRPAANTRRALMREKMLEKAAELFYANGFGKTSINDIADSLTLKRSSLYHYFPNKEAILRELFVEEFERRISELQSLFDRDDLSATERLELAVEGAITQRLRGGGRFLVFDRLEPEVPDELRKNYNRGRRQILDLYTGLVEDGIRVGEFRPVDPQLTAFAMIGMSNWTALWYSPSGRMKPREIARSLTNLLVHGISQHTKDTKAALADEIHSIIDGMRRDMEQLTNLIKNK